MYATNVCRRDGDVLLRTNTLEDELHTRKLGSKIRALFFLLIILI